MSSSDIISFDDIKRAFSESDVQQTIDSLFREYWGNEGKLAQAIKQCELLEIPQKPTKHIGAFYHSYTGGGAEKVMVRLASLWLSMGYDVTIFVDSDSEQDISVLPAGVTVVTLPPKSTVQQGKYAHRGKILSEEIKTRNIDTFVYHAWLSHIMLWDLLEIKLNGVKFIVHTHGLFTHRLRAGSREFAKLPYVYSLADAVVCLNETDKLFWSNFNKNTYLTVNPFPDVQPLEQPPSQHGKTILWLGGFAETKHPEEAIEIFRAAHSLDPEINFIFAGGADDTEYEKSIEKLIEQSDLGDAISMPGWLNQSEKLAAYERADLFLMTSDATEGYPLTLIESKAFALPCVIYELPYLAVMKNPRGICSVQQGDSDSAAQEIVRILNNDSAWHELSEQALASLSEIKKFDFEEFWHNIFSQPPNNGPEENSPERLLWDTLFDAYLVELDNQKSTVRKLKIQIREKNETLKALKSKRGNLLQKTKNRILGK